jgi:probable DNA metabolism protein
MVILSPEKHLAGFLTAVFQVYRNYNNRDVKISSVEEQNFIDARIEIATEISLARRVRNGIIEAGGPGAYQAVSDAYLSGNREKEEKIRKFLAILFKEKYAALTMYQNPDVIAFNDILAKVRNEAHRMRGFLRFRELESGVFYSFFKTDNDILELVIPHFTARFNTQKFAIHDIGRGKIAYFDGEKTDILPAPENMTITLSEDEEAYEKLWKDYFKTVAIKERENKKLQRRFLPKKYRFFMNEF